MNGGMPPAPGGGNLPYGTSMSDPHAPWNAPERTEWTEDDLIDYALDEMLGDTIIDRDDGRWSVEVVNPAYPKGWQYEGRWRTEWDAVAYAIVERQDDIEKWLDEREAERIADGPDESDDHPY